MEAFGMERLEAKFKSLALELQSMLKEMQQMLVAMLACIDQFLGNPTRLDQTVSNQSCDPTKSSHNQGEMERSNNQTKHEPTNSRCVINLEEYKKCEPIKTNRLKIKKQKRRSSWQRKKKKKKKKEDKNPLRTWDDFRRRECYGATC
jgi:hypothetical protein